MKIEVNIDKKILMIVIGIFLIGTGVYAAVNTSLPYHPASQVQFSDGSSLEDMKTFSPGNITIAHSILTSSSSGISYSLIKEIQIAQGGTVNVSFDLVECGSYDGYGKIYVNGVARGTERKTGSSSYRTYSENIDVNAGDKIQLYTKCGGSYVTNYVTAKNFKVQVSGTFPIATTTYEGLDESFKF